MGSTFESKVAVVTNAGSGIGRASALAFAREGAAVAVSDGNPDDGRETVAMIEKSGQAAIFVAGDVRLEGDVMRLVEEVVTEFGRLDVAHNNGGATGQSCALADGTEENWYEVLLSNLTSIWQCMRAEIPPMLASGGGAIVNTSSVAGLVGIPGLSAYCASKHGVVGLTRAAALDYARLGVRINAICPGTTMTPALEALLESEPSSREGLTAPIPLGRIATPAEIAEAAVWLCGDRASFLTGAVLPVDGAVTAQ